MATDPDTVLDDNGGNPPADPAAAPAQTGPQPEPKEPANDDWRSTLAGEDKTLLGFLGRYHSKDAALKAWKQQHDDIRAGKYVKPLGDDASDEDKAAWHKMLGVPEKVEGYLENLPDGLAIGDDDKPAVDTFLAKMHEAGAPKAASDAALQAYYAIVEDQAAAEVEAIDNHKAQAIEALKDEWGPEYRRNINIINNYMTGLPDDVQAAISGGRGADGMPLASSPAVLKWLAGLAMEANPVATVVPGAGANQASAIADEIAQIENLMRTDRAAYNRDSAKQARLRELYDAREKLKA